MNPLPSSYTGRGGYGGCWGLEFVPLAGRGDANRRQHPLRTENFLSPLSLIPDAFILFALTLTPFHCSDDGSNANMLPMVVIMMMMMMMFKKRGAFLGLFSLPAVVPLWSSLPLNKPAPAPPTPPPPHFHNPALGSLKPLIHSK